MDTKCIIIYIEDFLSKDEINNYFKKLEHETKWRGGMMTETREVPRHQIWCHEKGDFFSSIWKEKHSRWESQPYSEYMITIQNKVQSFLNKFCVEKNINPKITKLLLKMINN